MCQHESFPRTDPVVIMLVLRPATHERPSRCLLGRHSRLPRGAYSLLAGFVEQGESLEDAQWFTAAEIATFGEWEDDSATFRRPRRDSIARVLLDKWVAEEAAAR